MGETKISDANDAFQQARSPHTARNVLVGLTRAELVGVADLNYVEHDGRRKSTVIRDLMQDRFGN